MIDTIVFQLHSINSKTINLAPDVKHGKVYQNDFNRLLYERLLNWESSYIERSVKFKANCDIENADDTFFLRQSNPRIFTVKREGGILQDKEKTEMFFYPASGKVQTASSDYHTNFRVLENRDTIEFTLAIPKYFYGHNIAQFVPNLSSKRFSNNPFSMREFSGQIGCLHQRLIEFIYTFFNDLSELLSMPSLQNFDMDNIEIKRLDFCYNQLFPSSSMAADFINAQRKFYKSRTRKDSQTVQDRDTSLFYRHSTDGFFFKIYKKGEEFIANDYTRLSKINSAFYDDNQKALSKQFSAVFEKYFPDTFAKHNGKVSDLIFQYYKSYAKTDENLSYCLELEFYFPFKLAFLTQEAKKILRYEMSFTSTYMSTIYKREIFRAKDSNWKTLMKRHNLVKRYDLLLSQGSQNKAKDFKFKHRIVNEDRSIYEIIDRSLHKKHQFFLSTPKRTQIFETKFLDFSNIASFRKYKLEESHEATLSTVLLESMFKKFRDEIEFFQLKNFEDSVSVLDQIDAYNLKVSEKIKHFENSMGKASLQKMTHTKKRQLGYSKLNKPRIKIVIDKLAEGMSIEQIIEKFGFSKSSKYELLKDLKIFGIHKQTVKTKFNHELIRTDFRTYYEKFQVDRQYHRKLFPNPYLISFDCIRDYFTNSFYSAM